MYELELPPLTGLVGLFLQPAMISTARMRRGMSS
jgi:hypothetical protein